MTRNEMTQGVDKCRFGCKCCFRVVFCLCLYLVHVNNVLALSPRGLASWLHLMASVRGCVCLRVYAVEFLCMCSVGCSRVCLEVCAGCGLSTVIIMPAAMKDARKCKMAWEGGTDSVELSVVGKCQLLLPLFLQELLCRNSC